MKGLLTTLQAADRLGCTAQWVQALCKDGRLDCIQIGGIYLIRETTVTAYKRNRKPVGRPPAKGHTKAKATKRR